MRRVRRGATHLAEERTPVFRGIDAISRIPERRAIAKQRPMLQSGGRRRQHGRADTKLAACGAKPRRQASTSSLDAKPLLSAAQAGYRAAMRHLLLLRHAKAVESSANGDFERELAPRGRRQAETFGGWLAGQSFAPTLIIASPARRTRETADIVVGAPAKPARRRDDPRLYNSSASDILSIVRATDTNIETLMIVGHNPGIAEFANRLTGSGDATARGKMARKFPPCACAIIAFAGSDWRKLAPGLGRLEEFVTSKSLDTSRDR